MEPPTQIVAYEGIQVRSKTLPIPISAPMAATQTTCITASSIPTSPILKAQLSAPATSTQQNSPLVKREILGKVIQFYFIFNSKYILKYAINIICSINILMHINSDLKCKHSE